MANSFREDSEGVASTVATLFALLCAVLFLQAAVISVIPAREYEAERNTSVQALQALDYIRYAAVGAAVQGGQFSVTIPLGTPATSAFATASDGTLAFNTGSVAPANISLAYVPTIHDSRITKVDQDIILAIDSSGSMNQNDPGRLRIQAAKDYIGRLTRPDRVASVDFDSVAHLTLQNIGGPAHHLFSTYNNGIPDYSGAQTDLNSIDQSGSTNFGAALFVANNELISYGVRGKAWVIILLTDGQNTCCPNQAAGDAFSQAGGATIHQGIPFEYTPRDLGTGSLRVTLITFVGAPFQAAGSDYAFINAQFLYANTNEQTIIRPDLGEQATAVGNTSAYVQYWGSQGAATPGAVAAVRQPLNQAQARLNWGETNASAGKLSLAKFNVDSAQSQLSAAVTATNQQVTLGNMQSWLGKAENHPTLFPPCLLHHCANLANGITLTIQSPSAAAWALWFVDAFRTTGALTTYGFSGNTVVLTVNAVDRFTVDERVIQLSTS